MLYFGVDVGNFDTKSRNTVIPSGFEGPYAEKPMLANHSLKVNNQYYIPSEQRLFYLKDKTEDNRALVLTLMSIANEIIYREKKNGYDNETIQRKIDDISEIALGVGLPVSHYNKEMIDSLKSYYTKHMGKGIQFDYDEFRFSFILKGIQVYPQGGAAAMCKANKIAEVYNTYYVVDIGGYTVDVARFVDGQPSNENFSLEMGIIILYDEIVEKVLRETKLTIDHAIITSVLTTKQSVILKEEAIKIIKEMTMKHANDILNSLRQRRIMFDSYPVLFVGGGSIFLKPYLLKNPLITKDASLFIKDTCANAKGYERMIRIDMEG